jgi:hypothetical protein
MTLSQGARHSARPLALPRHRPSRPSVRGRRLLRRARSRPSVGRRRSAHSIPPARKFDGIIGGPPCQSWSGLGNTNRARWGDDCMMPDRIPEFARCINEAQPGWFSDGERPASSRARLPRLRHHSARGATTVGVGGEQSRPRTQVHVRLRDTVSTALFTSKAWRWKAANHIPVVLSSGQAGQRRSACARSPNGDGLRA